MDFSYSEDQQALRELARKILEEQASHDRLKEILETPERVDRELWSELAKANLLGIAIDEAHEGSGFGLSELVILLEEVGRSVAPIPVFPTLVLAALPIAAFGSNALKSRWLPAIARGEAFLSAALVDGSEGVVKAEHDGTGWRLSGVRRLVQAGHVAQRVLVPASTGAGSLGIFLVDPAAEHAKFELVDTTDQQYRTNLHLDGARVPDAEVLGDPMGGAPILAWLRQRATLGLCAMQVGVAERALEITASYARERKQFGQPIGSFQAFHTRAGDAYVDVQAMKLTLWRALHLLECGEDAEENLEIAKYWAAEGGARVTYAAMHLHGGIGVDIDYPIHRYYLWGRQIGMHLGSGAAQLAKIGAGLAA